MAEVVQGRLLRHAIAMLVLSPLVIWAAMLTGQVAVGTTWWMVLPPILAAIFPAVGLYSTNRVAVLRREGVMTPGTIVGYSEMIQEHAVVGHRPVIRLDEGPFAGEEHVDLHPLDPEAMPVGASVDIRVHPTRRRLRSVALDDAAVRKMVPFLLGFGWAFWSLMVTVVVVSSD